MLVPDLIKCVLEWAFDPDTSEWASEVFVRCKTEPRVIDFIWSMYVVGRCRPDSPGDCRCLKRGTGIVELVLRQSSRVDIVRPWCSKLKALGLTHNHEKFFRSCGLFDDSFSKVDSLCQISECGSWDQYCVGKACEHLACVGSASAMWFLVRVINVYRELKPRAHRAAWRQAARNGHVTVLEYLHKRGLAAASLSLDLICA